MTGIKEIIRNVNGMRLKFTENNLISPEEPLPLAPNAPGNHFSRVSTDGRRYLVLWKDYRSGLAAVYGRIVEFPKGP
ncbi:MAG: hypothetical protein HYR80_07705 [Nitrospirae bacterium]|nr:hypothetical protein [Nitrospirota bacterium]